MRIWRVYPLKRGYPTNTMNTPLASFIAPDNAKLFHFHIKFTIVCEKTPYNHLIIIISSVVYLLCKKHISSLHARGHRIVKISAGPTDMTIMLYIGNIVIIVPWHILSDDEIMFTGPGGRSERIAYFIYNNI